MGFSVRDTPQGAGKWGHFAARQQHPKSGKFGPEKWPMEDESPPWLDKAV
jgi:hypothetical protein